MSRGRAFRCQECAAPHPSKWVGRCPSCLAWNSLVEAPPVRSAGDGVPAPGTPCCPVPMREVPAVEGAAAPTGLAELDRVLSGGRLGVRSPSSAASRASASPPC